MAKELTIQEAKRMVTDYIDATVDARELSEKCRDYYDGEQWSAKERSDLAERAQPAIVINRVAKKINYLLGTEIRTRTDPEASPRTPQHEDAAQSVTDALRYVSDAEQLPQTLTEVFEAFVVEGYGGAVVEVEAQTSANDDAEATQQWDVKVRPVPWDRLIYDPHSRRWDFSDARFLGVAVWMDADDAKDLYADYAGADKVLDSVVDDSSLDDTLADRPEAWFDAQRQRVKIIELYYRRGLEWYVCHFAGSGYLIEPERVEYVDERGRSVCPLIMASAFVDRENGRYGLIRGMISPQDEVNKRRSKALWLLSTRQSIGDAGAVDPATIQTQKATPDAHIEVQPGMRFEIVSTDGMAQSQFQLMAEAKMEIDTIGPDAGTIAGTSAGQSGRAVLARQQMASLELEKTFDRFRWLKAQVYRHVWYRIRQFWTTERWFRVRDEAESAGYRFTGLNRQMTRLERLKELLDSGSTFDAALKQAAIPEAQAIMQAVEQQVQAIAQQAGEPPPEEVITQEVMQALARTPGGQEVITTNSVDQLDVDIVLSEAPDTAILQQEEFEELASMAGRGIPIPPKLIIEASHLRNKKRLIELLDEPQPGQQEAAQFGQAMQQAALEKTASEAQRNQAQAARYMVEAEQGLPAQAQRDHAAAVNAVADAGHKVGSLEGALATAG